MFPLSDLKTHHARVNRWIIAINILVFLWVMLVSGGYLGQQSINLLEKQIPYLVFTPAVFSEDPVQGVISLFGSMFMHAGILHLLGNMWFLWVFGDNIEDHLGSFRYLMFYLAGGIAAALTETYMGGDPALSMVGASGAVAAVLGAYLVILPRAWIRTYLPPIFIFHVPAYVFLPYWAIVQYLSILAGEAGVAFYAHLGGFVFGFVAMLLLRRRPSSPVTHPS